MSEIKAVLSSLCTVLRSITNVNVEAEHFKEAKFNKINGNSTAVLWNVLHACCSSCGNGENCKGVVLCVKMCFAACHYDDFTFYCLPHDMSFGCREALLAFGWLLADTNAIEVRLLEYVKMKLFSGLFKEAAEVDVPNSDSLPENLSDDDLCNYVMWLAGRLKQSLRGITNMASERVRLTAKIHAATKDVYDLPYLTVEQILLLKSYDKQPEKQNEVKKVKSILEDYFYFVERSKLFWSWMESVLSEDINNRNAFQGNLEDLDKFLVMLRADVRSEILKEPSDDYIVLFNHLKSKFINCAFSDRNMKNSLAEMKTDIKQLDSLCKDNVSDIKDSLEKLSIDCQR